MGSTSIGVPTVYGTEMYLIETPMTDFFEDKNYGKGCKEINYVQFCVNTEIFNNYVDGGHYEPRKQKIVCSVEMEYKTSMAFTYRHEFATYIKNRFLNKAMDFYELDIPDFDLDSYISDLEQFFIEYLSQHKNGEM